MQTEQEKQAQAFKAVSQPFEQEAQELVARARKAGVVLTIEQVPLKPLAMGHHQSVVSARKGTVNG